jgi:hypothetical protein
MLHCVFCTSVKRCDKNFTWIDYCSPRPPPFPILINSRHFSFPSFFIISFWTHSFQNLTSTFFCRIFCNPLLSQILAVVSQGCANIVYKQGRNWVLFFLQNGPVSLTHFLRGLTPSGEKRQILFLCDFHTSAHGECGVCVSVFRLS